MTTAEQFETIKVKKTLRVWIISKSLTITITAGDQSAWANELIEVGVPDETAVLCVLTLVRFFTNLLESI